MHDGAERALRSSQPMTHSPSEPIRASQPTLDVALHLDHELRLTFVSDGALEAWGLRSEDLIGRALPDVFPAKMGTSGIERLRAALAEQRGDRFRTFSHTLGREVDVRFYPTGVGLTVTVRETRTRVQDERSPHGQTPRPALSPDTVTVLGEVGTPGSAVMVGLDVAERQAAEAALREVNATLEFRVGERTRELEIANRELEAFSYSVSHDLRTPLRHVSGFAALLRQRASGQLDAPSLRYLDLIEASANRMSVLIDELLGFARLATRPLRLHPCDLNVLVKGVIDELQPDVGTRQISWRIGPLPTVSADEPLLKVVLTNLLSNAIKYTARRDTAEVWLGGELHADEWRIFVRDNGAGFDPAYAEKLFGVFQRLHREVEFEGVGIGLANVRRIVERHGGRVWAEGHLGEGATFWFSLPR